MFSRESGFKVANESTRNVHGIAGFKGLNELALARCKGGCLNGMVESSGEMYCFSRKGEKVYEQAADFLAGRGFGYRREDESYWA